MTDAAGLPSAAVAAMAHCPEELHYLIEQQVWARIADGGVATIGITSLGIALAGDIYMCRPKRAGSLVKQGDSIAVVELAKSIVAVRSPVTGEVIEVNPLLEEQPELVHRQPYGDGWLVRMRLTDWEHDQQHLLHGQAVLPAMRHHAWLHRLEF
jgi:glycine cleavage system H protein